MTTTTYASPLSFVGSARRFSALARRQTGVWAIIAWTLIILIALPVTWVLLLAWYAIIFGLFGLLTIPFRFMRRSQRKTNAIQTAQLEHLKKLG